MTIKHEIKKYMMALDHKVNQSNTHLQFMVKDGQVRMKRYHGFWKAVAALAMLIPAQSGIPGPLVRTFINFVFTDNAGEGFNLLRSFLPGTILKATGLDAEPWADALFLNGLNAPATVVGTDGMVYRVDGNFPADYKNAGSYATLQVSNAPITYTADDGTTTVTIDIPNIVANLAPDPETDPANVTNLGRILSGSPTFDPMILLDSIELQFRNACSILSNIDTYALDNLQKSLLKGICSQVVRNTMQQLFVIRKQSSFDANVFYMSALANLVRSMDYNVEHEGAIQYRQRMFHDCLDDPSLKKFILNPVGGKISLQAGNRPESVPESTWNNAKNAFWKLDTAYARSIRNLAPDAATKYNMNLLENNSTTAAKEMLCFKAYSYAYGSAIGPQIKAMVQGGILNDTNAKTSFINKNAFFRNGIPALSNLLLYKPLVSAFNWRNASADSYARLLFPLAMYSSLLEMRFGTHNTGVLKCDPVVSNDRCVFTPDNPSGRISSLNQQTKSGFNGYHNRGLCQVEMLNLIEPNTLDNHKEIRAHFMQEMVALGYTFSEEIVDQQTVTAGVYRYTIQERRSGSYDRTLLGIIDCLLSAAYFVYQTMGWDYSLAKLSTLTLLDIDKFKEWQLFDDPQLIGYISLRKQYIVNYDQIIKKHCDYLKEMLQGDTSWWAPTPITWRGPVGSLSSAAARPSAWLAATLDDMCDWLINSAGQEHDWSFSDAANNKYSENINNVHEYNALSSRNQNTNLSEYIAQQMDYAKGDMQANGQIRDRLNNAGNPLNAKYANLNDTRKSCKLIAEFLNGGGDPQRAIHFILKLLYRKLPAADI